MRNTTWATLWPLGVAALVAGCGSDSFNNTSTGDASASGPGGSSGKGNGGATADASVGSGGKSTGGSSGSGGTPGSGGGSATGGSSGSGGSGGSGGSVASGGQTNTGGTSAPGGAVGSGGTGGLAGTGGITGSGGTQATGGLSGSGGVTGFGGTPTTGGVTGSGGTLGSGGTVATGGTSTLDAGTEAGLPSCTATSLLCCGNSKVDPGEECDDGNQVLGDGCENGCKFTCTPTDSTRDCHASTACVTSGTCSTTTHICSGSTPTSAGTACGTNKNCIYGSCDAAICGDGILAQGIEACDDGNQVAGDGCETTCKLSCSAATAATDCSGRTPDCRKATCLGDICSSAPDATKDGAACNTGGGVATCHTGACTTGTCGNGTKEAGEQCDDGNLTAGDGCEPNCTFGCNTNADCNDGDPCDGLETCVTVTGGKKCAPGSSQADGTACGTGELCVSASCRPSFCGDGITDSATGETCDPPNTVGCDSTCTALQVCNLGGIWAMKVTSHVSWGDGSTLVPATGDVQQWTKVTVTQTGGSTAFTATLLLRFAPTGTGRCVLDGTGYAGHAVARGRRWPGRAA